VSAKLGVTLPQFTSDPEAFKRAAIEAEAAGLDSVWVFDHLWPLSGGKERPILEAWTALGWLAAATSHLTIGTLVTRSSLRHPALVAKMAATLANIAPGRLIVGIGSGDELSRAENEAFGARYYSSDDRMDQLREAVEVITNYLQQPEVTASGDFVAIDDLPVSPRPPVPPPVWVAGRSDDALEIAALLGDGWNGWGGTPDRFAADAATVTEMANGRALDLTWGGLAVVAPSDEAARDLLVERAVRADIAGGPATVATALNGFADTGATHLILTRARGAPGALRILGEDVKPRLR